MICFLRNLFLEAIYLFLHIILSVGILYNEHYIIITSLLTVMMTSYLSCTVLGLLNHVNVATDHTLCPAPQLLGPISDFFWRPVLDDGLFASDINLGKHGLISGRSESGGGEGSGRLYLAGMTTHLLFSPVGEGLLFMSSRLVVWSRGGLLVVVP